MRSLHRSSPFHSAFTTSAITYHRFGHVYSLYRGSPFRSTLNTNVITGGGIHKACSEAAKKLRGRLSTANQVHDIQNYLHTYILTCMHTYLPIYLPHGEKLRQSMCHKTTRMAPHIGDPKPNLCCIYLQQLLPQSGTSTRQRMLMLDFFRH